MIFQLMQYGLGLAFAIIAVTQDVKSYKIRNKTVLIFLVLGIVLSLIPNGPCSPLQSIVGVFVPLILLPLFVLKMLGAGDIKAFCALGAIFGASEIIKIMIFSIICGGAVALCFMIFRKNSINRFKYFGNYIKTCFIMRKLMSYNGIVQKDSVFRFAYAVAAGVAVYIFYRIA